MYKLVTKTLARTLRTPPYLILFVSDVCWMYCKHCWFSEEWKHEHLKEDTLTYDELSRLASSMPRVLFLSFTGGEAFLRKDIVDITHVFARKTRLSRYQIPTSGYDTGRILKAAEQMLTLNKGIPFRVDVSLDGIGETHDLVRNRKGSYENAVRTLGELNQLRKHHANFDVGVITTISRYNQHEVETIGEEVARIHPDGEWMVNITRGKPREPAAREVDMDAYCTANEMIERRVAEGRFRGHGGHATAKWLTAKNATRRKVITSMLEGRHPGGGCAAGSLGGVIYSDGRVFPCEMLEEPLGNVREFDFDFPKLWNSPRADEVRALIQDTKCLCTQECFLSVSLLIQPRYWPDMVRERARLLRGPAEKNHP
jgi:MoaA/NifB/PqqE/SkfB family radical SAM enzyme